MQLLLVAFTLDGLDRTGLDWTGLDWTGLDWTGLGAATPVDPLRAKGVYSLAYMLQGR